MRYLRSSLSFAAPALACLAWSCSGDSAGADTVDIAHEVTPDTTAEVTPDTATPDTAPQDTASADTSKAETAGDTGEPTPDTAVADTGVADTEPADTAAPVDTTVTPPPEVRFIVIGDTGEGNDRQRKVAAAIKNKCARDGCDFALLMGDNIYNAGVESTFDAQWETKFEGPYRELEMPFYAVLGNHDNGGFLTQWLGDLFGGAGAEFERGDHQVAYTQYSSKWRMPGRTYDFLAGPAHFFALDTNDMVWSRLNDDAEARTQIQMDEFPGLIDDSSATWKIAFGHHPYISNGKHGDAGEYEGLEEGITNLVAAEGWLGDLSGVVTGDGVKEALDRIVCDRVDLYFSGHDHSRQWLLPTAQCPRTTFVVSGAGAKMTTLGGDHTNLFQDISKAGFFWVHLRGRELNAEAIDEDGLVQWSHQAFK